MTSQTITIPAREVRPGDVLFGMTVETSDQSSYRDLWFVATNRMPLWFEPGTKVTVERPVPSDPIGTVRAKFFEFDCVAVYRKGGDNEWCEDGVRAVLNSDADVADFPILWKPGMPIPTEGVAS